MAANAVRFRSFYVKFYLPTRGIGFSQLNHHHLFIPKLYDVWNHIIQNVIDPIVYAFYEILNNCDEGITLDIERGMWPENFWPSYETFKKKAITAQLFSNGENPIELVSYTPDLSQQITWQSYFWRVRVKEGNPRKCPKTPNKDVRITFGPEYIITDMFHCDGHLDCKVVENRIFVERFLRWYDKSKDQPLRITNGLILVINFKGPGWNYAIYNPTVNALEYLKRLFEIKILTLPQIKNNMILTPTHFGYSVPLKMITRFCQTDKDPTMTFTHGGELIGDSNEPHVIEVQFNKSTPEAAEVEFPKRICGGASEGGSNVGESGGGVGGDGGGSGSSSSGGSGGRSGRGTGGQSGNRPIASKDIQTQQFPLWILLIPVAILLLKMRKGG